MARIYPFRALRYNPSLVRVEDCVTQPYDKISPSMQQSYYQKSPYNLVRIILGLPELFDGEDSGDVYTRAARDYKDWRAQGVLAPENEPCVFAYSQRFTVPGSDPNETGEGTVVERRGLIALGELYEYSAGVVFRHEQTLTKPRADRLNLLRATHAHFGQIFMLYSDPAQTVEKLIYNEGDVPDIEVTDEYDVLHRVWKVSDPATINMVIGELQDKKLIIADGHHRYETALNYSKERAPAQARTLHAERSATSLPQPLYPEAAVMMTLVNMDADGLVILPTHRVVHGLAGFAPEAFFVKAAEYFELNPLAPDLQSAEADALLASLKAAGNDGCAMVAVTRAGATLLKAKPAKVREALADVSDRKQQLDIVQLHQLVLEQLLAISAEAIRDQQNLRYVRDANEAVNLVRRGEADIAFLVNPVTLDQLREITFAGEVMPQKSTDFFPKLLSGLAVYALD